jgi:plasmid stabilization system protein ParE
MSFQIQFAEIAKQDLRDIWRGLAEYSGLAFADSTLANMESKFRLLVEFPGSQFVDRTQRSISIYTVTFLLVIVYQKE